MGYIGSQPATNFETVRKQVSTTNSGTTITLDYAVSSVQDILVTVNAVVQSYDNYTVSGTTLTLGGTLNNDRVEILYVGRTFQTVSPAVGTVTNDMLAGSIANSKLANSSITLNGSAVSLGGSATVGGTNTPMWFASLSSDQSVGDAVSDLVNFDNEVIDTDSAFTTGTDAKMTIPSGADGKYLVTAQIHMKSDNANRLRQAFTSIKKNGSIVAQSPNSFSNNDIFTFAPMVSTILDLSASDYLQVEGYLNTEGASSQVFGGASLFKTFFQGHKLIT